MYPTHEMFSSSLWDVGDLPLTLLANFLFFAEIALSTFERL